VKFFRFNGGLAAILLVIALAFRLQATGTGLSTSDVWLIFGSAVTVFYWATIGRVFTPARTAILGLAAGAGLIAVALQGVEIASGFTPGPSAAVVALTVLSFLTSAAMLGGACTAMILGHWYLVIPSMEVKHLQRAVGYHIVTLALRISVVAVVLLQA